MQERVTHLLSILFPPLSLFFFFKWENKQWKIRGKNKTKQKPVHAWHKREEYFIPWFPFQLMTVPESVEFLSISDVPMLQLLLSWLVLADRLHIATDKSWSRAGNNISMVQVRWEVLMATSSGSWLLQWLGQKVDQEDVIRTYKMPDYSSLLRAIRSAEVQLITEILNCLLSPMQTLNKKVYD